MKYYLIAGEASGDLHASGLITALKLHDPEAEIRFWGGDRMLAAGGTLIKHYRDLAFMGFAEVLMNLKRIMSNLRFCKKDLIAFQPDALILIDYPGFNLRIARFARQQGLKVFYYISPQVWAWKKSRVKSIKRNVDRMFVILPFEKDFYKKYDYDVEYVGHPLLDAILPCLEKGRNNDFTHQQALSGKKIVALLPGSRKQEVMRILPVMLDVVKLFPDFEFVVAALDTVDASIYEELIGDLPVKIVRNSTYELLMHAHAAVVTSGTACLETALFNVPQVIAYKGSPLSFAIARCIVNIKYIGLPNLVMEREIVREIIQSALTSQNLCASLKPLLYDETTRSEAFSNYASLRERLGGGGASEKTALGILRGIQLLKP